MIKTIIKLYEQCVTWAIQHKNKITSDPFLVAQIKLAILFFIVSSAIAIIISEFSDRSLRSAVYEISLLDTGTAVEEAFKEASKSLWFWRTVRLVFSVIAAYFLTIYAFRPVKKSANLYRRFASVVSHELRTPITVIKSSIEVALRNKENLTLEKAVTLIESNKEEVQKLFEIIDFILTFSKFKENSNFFVKDTLKLTSVVDGVLSDLKKESGDKDFIKIEILSEGEILGNQTALYILISNLLKNAIIHNTQNKDIKIKIFEEKNVTLSITDEGAGISKEDLPYIFEPFYQGKEGNDEAKIKGVGLGLSIVKEIVNLHNASIFVDSEKNKGTTFSVVFNKT